MSGQEYELLSYDQIWDLNNNIHITTVQGKLSTERERQSLKIDLQSQIPKYIEKFNANKDSQP